MIKLQVFDFLVKKAILLTNSFDKALIKERHSLNTALYIIIRSTKPGISRLFPSTTWGYPFYHHPFW